MPEYVFCYQRKSILSNGNLVLCSVAYFRILNINPWPSRDLLSSRSHGDRGRYTSLHRAHANIICKHRPFKRDANVIQQPSANEPVAHLCDVCHGVAGRSVRTTACPLIWQLQVCDLPHREGCWGTYLGRGPKLVSIR